MGTQAPFWLWLGRTPGLPAASIWALSELPVSCRWGRHSSSFGWDWFACWLIQDGLSGLFFSVFLPSALPGTFDLCKGRGSRQGMVMSQHGPPMASSASFAKTKEREEGLDLSGMRHETASHWLQMRSGQYWRLYSPNIYYFTGHWKLILLEEK